MIQSINIYSTVIPYTQHVLIINVISMRVQKFINFFFSLIACIPLLGIIQLSTKNYPTKGKNFQAFICHNSLEKFSHNISCLKLQSNYNKQIHYKISQEHDSIWNKKFISLLPHKYSRKFHLTKNDQAKALERKEKKCKKIASHETFSSKPNRT